jgi:4-amino-4-deoxy-L-arabinose transferase-like glycosyltransferase
MTSRGAWLALFAGYLLLQVAIRLMVGPALELDEAEALWFARDLRPGYNAQPPLYFWLQWGFFQVFGEGIAALALLKAALMWGSMAALFLWLADKVPVVQAGVAVLALGLLPQVVWEAQRALTHSVLVFAMAVGFVVVFDRMLRRGGWTDVVTLGVVTGLGVISKYNFALVPAGFVLWAAVAREGRRADWRRIGMAMGLAAVIVAPVAVWALVNREVAAGSLHKLGIEEAGFLRARAEGMFSLIVGVVSFLGLAIVALGGLWLTRDRRAALRPEVVRYLAGGVAGAGVLLVAGVLLAGVTEVKDRWLLPVAWPLVPAAVMWLWPVLGQRQRRGLGIGAAACWVVAMLALPWASLRDPGYRAADFAGLEAALAAVDPTPEAIVSDLPWVLGNLVLRGQDVPLVWATDGGQAGLLVTEAGQGVTLAGELGLVPGVPVEHVIERGTRVTRVEILPVTRP